MRKLCLRLTILIALLLLFQFTSPLSHGQYRCPPGQSAHGWPIEPMNQGHPIGNSFGEFQDYGRCISSSHCVYQHAGIDILGTPKYDSIGPNAVLNPSASWVLVTLDGTVDDVGGSEGCDSQDQSDDVNSYTVSINGDDGQIHQYGHLQRCSYDPTFLLSVGNNGQKVTAGSPIAQLVRWMSCDYHHLHYEIIKGNNYMSPLACITPHQDGEFPQIVSISFAVNSSGGNSHDWVPLNTVDPQGCTVVYGEVDIVAQIRDRDSAGSNHVGTKTLWVHNVRWRACPESNPNCPWNNTYFFDSMPTAWHQGNNNATSAYFSVSKPWESKDDYCLEAPLYAVVTNFVGGIPDKAGFWDTGKIPNGNYVVSVEATDFAGKTAVSSVNVCVRNNVPPSSPRNLRIQ